MYYSAQFWCYFPLMQLAETSWIQRIPSHPHPPLCLVLPQRCRKILVLPSGYWLTSIDIPKQNAACSKSSLDLLKKKWINKIHWSPNCFLYRRNVMNVTKNYWSIVTKQLYRRHGSHQSWIKEWFDAYRRQIASWTNTDY